MVRVVCPMCDRPGFVAKQDIGKDVKCCNPECLVPVFVAQPPVKEKTEPEPDEETSSGAWLYWVMGVIILGGAGFLAKLMLFDTKPPNSSDDLGLTNGPVEQTSSPENGKGETSPQNNPQDQPPKKHKLDPAKFQQEALAELLEYAQDVKGVRGRNYATRLVAEALIQTGQTEKARQELSKLGTNHRYLSVSPLSMLAWRQLAAGDSEHAGKTLDAAMQAAVELPAEGRYALDATGLLAAALTAAGRSDEARNFIAQHDDPKLGQLSTLWMAMREAADRDFLRVSNRPCLRDLPDPQWATVTHLLATRKQWDAAREWISHSKTVDVADSCSAILAAEIVTQLSDSPEQVVSQIEQIVSERTPAGQTRVWSAAGIAWLETGHQDEATAMAEKAAASLAAMDPIQPVTLPDMLALYRLASSPDRGLPKSPAIETAGFAAIELAQLRYRLGQTDQARNHLEQALRITQGIAPDLNRMQKVFEECQRTGPTRRKLAKLLEIAEATAFDEFSNYQAQCRAWHDRSMRRFHLEELFLRRVMSEGALTDVWKIINPDNSAETSSERQSYETSSLPAALRDLARFHEDQTLAQVLTQTFPDSEWKLSSQDRIHGALLRFQAGRIQQPVALSILRNEFNAPAVDQSAVTIDVLRTTQHLTTQPEQAVQFAASIPDTLLREDSLFLAATRSVILNQPDQMRKAFDPRVHSPTDTISLFLGFIDGVEAARP